MFSEPKTWHYGLMARWWDEFNVAEADELAFYRDQVALGGGTALDLGCGTGRLLIPLLEEGLCVEGSDLSADMIGHCRKKAEALGLRPVLHTQAMHQLDTPRCYSTIYMCGSFGIGGERQHDREALRRCHQHLEDDGRLVLNYDHPYSDPTAWAYWTTEQRRRLPRPWPQEATRRVAGNGDELELRTRLVDFEPLEQRVTRESQITLWRNDQLVSKEEQLLRLIVYLHNELLLMLEMAGFNDVQTFAGYSGSPVTNDDPTIVYVATK